MSRSIQEIVKEIHRTREVCEKFRPGTINHEHATEKLRLLEELQSLLRTMADPDTTAQQMRQERIHQVAQSLFAGFLREDNANDAAKKAIDHATLFVDAWDKHVAEQNEKAGS